MSSKLKLQTVKQGAMRTIDKFFEQYADDIQVAYEDGGRNVKLGFSCQIALTDKGKVGVKTEINFVKIRVKDSVLMTYDPDQILFDFEKDGRDISNL